MKNREDFSYCFNDASHVKIVTNKINQNNIGIDSKVEYWLCWRELIIIYLVAEDSELHESREGARYSDKNREYEMNFA
mgnify:CR=1 FL=1